MGEQSFSTCAPGKIYIHAGFFLFLQFYKIKIIFWGHCFNMVEEIQQASPEVKYKCVMVPAVGPECSFYSLSLSAV